MNKIKQSILAIVMGLALVAGLSYAAWTDPTANPTGGNIDAPINVGSSYQAKSGYLSLATTTSPTVALNVAGASNYSGMAQFNSNILSYGDFQAYGQLLAYNAAAFNNTLSVSGTLTANSAAAFNNTLSVSGTLTANGAFKANGASEFGGAVKITAGAGAGKVLISDSSGNASWKSGFPKPDYDGKNASFCETKKPANCYTCDNNGWCSLSGLKGTEVTFSHNLGTLDTVVYIEGKDSDGQIHQNNSGSDAGEGARIKNKTENTVGIKRGSGDNCSTVTCWDSVRVLMWKIN